MIDTAGNIIPSLEILEDLQTVTTKRLQSCAWLSSAGTPGGLMILPEDKGDIVQRINTQLARIGLAVIVVLPQVGLEDRNVPASHLGSVLLQVSVIENYVVNRAATGSQKKASAVALAVLKLLHHWTPPGLKSCLCARTPNSIVQSADPERPSELIFDVFFQTSLPLITTELN